MAQKSALFVSATVRKLLVPGAEKVLRSKLEAKPRPRLANDAVRPGGWCAKRPGPPTIPVGDFAFWRILVTLAQNRITLH